MRKNMSFTVIAALVVLSVILWAGASLISTSDDIRSTAEGSFYGAETIPYLRLEAVPPVN